MSSTSSSWGWGSTSRAIATARWKEPDHGYALPFVCFFQASAHASVMGFLFLFPRELLFFSGFTGSAGAEGDVP